MTAPRRVLLVSPTFHGYWRAIEQALAAGGHEVTTVCYDANVGLVAKARHKVTVELPERLGGPSRRRLAAAQTARVCEAVASVRPQACVILKGDTLAEDFWRALDSPRIPRVTWLYDEVRRTRYTPAALRVHGPVASYSPSDAAALATAGVDASYLPLGYDHRLPFAPVPRANVSFIGARYPNREQLLHRLDAAGVPVHAYGREWSPAWRDRLRTWRLRNGVVPGSGDLPRDVAYGVMAGSAATLNIHGDQDGFTMRTFEASGVGGVQLVDRADVHLHYEPGVEVAVFDGPEALADVCRRALRDRRWAAGLREAGRRRTLAHHTLTHRVRELEALWAA